MKLFKRFPIFFLAIILFWLASCSPEKRLYRLLKNHPELSRHDTTYKSIEVKVNGVIHDTTFLNTITQDTVTIIDKQLTIKYYNDGKKVYIKGICDTIFKEIQVPVTITTISPAKEVPVAYWYDIFFRVLAAIFIGWCIVWYFFNRK